jgi:phospholipase C
MRSLESTPRVRRPTARRVAAAALLVAPPLLALASCTTLFQDVEGLAEDALVDLDELIKDRLPGTRFVSQAQLACGPDAGTGGCPSGLCSFPYGAPSPFGDARAADRAACAFGPDASAALTVDVRDAGLLLGADGGLPGLEHVVLLMLENRSFDHVFSDLGAVGVDASVADDGMSNPDGDGGVIYRFHAATYGQSPDPNHDWGQAHLAYAGGALDGFVAASQSAVPMSYYSACDLPVYYGLVGSQQVAISDRYFSALLGPTQPNRLFSVLATSCGYAEGNDTNRDVSTCAPSRNEGIVSLLGPDNVRIYDKSLVSLYLSLLVAVPVPYAQFATDVQNGGLPAFSIVNADNGVLSTEDDDHPPTDVRAGQQFVHDVIATLVSSPAWSSTALFITYDENGGFFDHVPPPHACDPDGPDAGATKRDYIFDQEGFRVPLILVSPFARRGYVSHYDADHTSILRFVEYWQGKGAMTYRDANAWPLLDMFDFTHGPSDAGIDVPAAPAFPSCSNATCADGKADTCDAG